MSRYFKFEDAVHIVYIRSHSELTAIKAALEDYNIEERTLRYVCGFSKGRDCDECFRYVTCTTIAAMSGSDDSGYNDFFGVFYTNKLEQEELIMELQALIPKNKLIIVDNFGEVGYYNLEQYIEEMALRRYEVLKVTWPVELKRRGLEQELANELGI